MNFNCLNFYLFENTVTIEILHLLSLVIKSFYTRNKRNNIGAIQNRELP